MVDVKAERILLDRKEMDIKADYLSSLVPPGTARYHFYRFKHTHEGDYQEAVGKGSPLPSLFLSSFPLLLCSSPPLSPLLSPSSFHPLPSPSPLPPLSLPPSPSIPPSFPLTATLISPLYSVHLLISWLQEWYQGAHALRIMQGASHFYC